MSCMKITVINGNEKKEILIGGGDSEVKSGRKRLFGLLDTKKDVRPIQKPKSLLEILRRNGAHFKVECGGMGTCGKCKVKFLEGATPVTIQDMTHISQEELDEGYRLACKSFPSEDVVVELLRGQ